jgi:DNA-directed RNA polymerase subunit alpha
MESLNVNVKNWKALIKPAKLDLQLSEDKSLATIIA